MGQKNIADSLADLIGRTPLLRPHNFCRLAGIKTELLFKLESFNPTGSVKDRTALAMILEAEKKGLLTGGSVITAPTLVNTGLALAMLAAARGYRILVTMPESLNPDRVRHLKALGAEVFLTPWEEGIRGAVRRAEELAAENPKAVLLNQLTSPANPEVHQTATAEEIWQDTGGRVDIFVAGAGTGGTVTGVGRGLKAKKRTIRIIAVEPAGSAVLSGEEPGLHHLHGLGPGFVPPVLDPEVCDEIFQVSNAEALAAARVLARTEGLMTGISSGAAAFAAAKTALRPENAGRTIAALLPDTGERYLNSVLFREVPETVCQDG
ncbi:MAG: cysteine synthase A, partial [Deltaproteobacteria bacterium]|nr:cysteine synthase A [Deltaproteobacteria bacterium]